MPRTSDVAHLIQLNGGSLIGKTRLQKSAYFLERKGVGFGFDYSYYHFGPYSEELANATDDAAALKQIEVKWKTSQGGTRYVVFHTLQPQPELDVDQNQQRRNVLEVLRKFSAVEVRTCCDFRFFEAKWFCRRPLG